MNEQCVKTCDFAPQDTSQISVLEDKATNGKTCPFASTDTFEQNDSVIENKSALQCLKTHLDTNDKLNTKMLLIRAIKDMYHSPRISGLKENAECYISLWTLENLP